MSQDPCFLINVFGKQECNHHWRGKGIHFMSAKWPPWSRSSCLAPVYLAISSHLAMSLSKNLKWQGTERVLETGPFGPVAHLGQGCVILRDLLLLVVIWLLLISSCFNSGVNISSLPITILANITAPWALGSGLCSTDPPMLFNCKK